MKEQNRKPPMGGPGPRVAENQKILEKQLKDYFII